MTKRAVKEAVAGIGTWMIYGGRRVLCAIVCRASTELLLLVQCFKLNLDSSLTSKFAGCLEHDSNQPGPPPFPTRPDTLYITTRHRTHHPNKNLRRLPGPWPRATSCEHCLEHPPPISRPARRGKARSCTTTTCPLSPTGAEADYAASRSGERPCSPASTRRLTPGAV